MKRQQFSHTYSEMIFSFTFNTENTKFPEQEESWYQGVTLKYLSFRDIYCKNERT